MKKLYILSAFLFAFNYLFSQGYTFKESFSLPNSHNGDDILKANSAGESLLIGSTFCYSGCNDTLYFVVLDKSGKRMVSKLFWNDTLSLSVSDCVQTSDGGFVFVGAVSANSTFRTAILKCNKNKKVEWARDIKLISSDYLLPRAIIESKDGNFIIASDVSARFSTSKLHIMKINKNGNLVWSTMLSCDLPYYPTWFKGEDLAETDDGFYFGGYFHYDGDIARDWSAIIKFTNGGKISYVKSFDIPFYYGTHYLTIKNLFPSKHSIYILGTYAHENRYGDIDVNAYNFLRFTDTSKTLTATLIKVSWQNLQAFLRKHPQILPLNFESYSVFYKDGGYGSIIPTENNFPKPSFYVEKHDSLGRICPDFTIPQVDTSTFIRRYKVSKVEYQIIKDSLSLSDFDIHDSTVNYENIICNDVASSAQFSNAVQQSSKSKSVTAITIFPNPAKNNFILNYQTNKDIEVSMTIYSALSKTVLFKKFNFNKGLNSQNINIQPLPAGIYFIKIQEGIKQTVLKVIKE